MDEYFIPTDEAVSGIQVFNVTSQAGRKEKDPKTRNHPRGSG
jgi:hypothetical protein